MNFSKYKDESDQYYIRFRIDAEKELEMTNEEASRAWKLVYKRAPEGGFQELFFHLKDIVNMIRAENYEVARLSKDIL
jgi:hypothetical protein